MRRTSSHGQHDCDELTGADITSVVHWPVAFPPGLQGFEPEDPNRPGWVVLDTEVTLVDTWKAMIALLNTGKVRHASIVRVTTQVQLNETLVGQGDWRLELLNRPH